MACVGTGKTIWHTKIVYDILVGNIILYWDIFYATKSYRGSWSSNQYQLGQMHHIPPSPPQILQWKHTASYFLRGKIEITNEYIHLQIHVPASKKPILFEGIHTTLHFVRGKSGGTILTAFSNLQLKCKCILSHSLIFCTTTVELSSHQCANGIIDLVIFSSPQLLLFVCIVSKCVQWSKNLFAGLDIMRYWGSDPCIQRNTESILVWSSGYFIIAFVE